MAVQEPALTLYGRQAELRLLESLLVNTHERGSALLVRGEAGIGKSALLAAAEYRARDRSFQVLSTTGVQSETQLPFSGLHHLLRQSLREMTALPGPQRNALSAAFGMTDESPPDRFLIALATLNLLSEIAGRAPLLVLAEDAQWLDRATCDVLTFVARRIDSDPLVLLAAIRDGFETALDRAGLPELRLEGLDEAAAGEFLQTHAPELPASHRHLVLHEALGNPLALVELPASVADRAELGDTLLAQLPLTTRLEQAFTTRMAELPEPTRALLLIAAVDDGDALEEVLGAAKRALGRAAGAADFAPAVEAGLIELDDTTVRFRHPLVRSAIVQAANVLDRRAAHAALADVLADDPDRRVWHRAASLTGPVDEVAAELEEAGERARRRGALSVAVVLFERAARLSSRPDLTIDRLLAAGEMACELGRAEVAQRLMRDAAQLPRSHRDEARLTLLGTMVGTMDMADPTNLRSIVEVARTAGVAGQVDLAVRLLTAAARACYWGSPRTEVRLGVLSAIEELPLAPLDPRLLMALAYAAPMERAATVLERIARLTPRPTEDPIAMTNVGVAAAVLSESQAAAKFLSVAVDGLRHQGRLGPLSEALMSLAWAETYLGNMPVASPAAEETVRLADETSQPLFAAGAKYVLAVHAALHGDGEATARLTSEVEQVAVATRAAALLCVIQLTRGLSALADGRYEVAFHELRRAFDPSDPAFHFTRCWAIGDLAEAAVHCGREAEARSVLAEIEHIGAESPMPWLQVGLAYARALLANDDEAEHLFDAALGSDLSAWPFFRARLHLARGEWLRRRRRVAESRSSLRAARDMFDALGFAPWGERARRELRAAGETSRDREPRSRELLTPQELQIARMASQGLSNREIGEQLFLSHRTVGAHLYRIFPKLGVTSRGQLAGALD